MIPLDEVEGWIGRTVRDEEGEKLGTVDHAYVDRDEAVLSFLAIKSGILGRHSSLIPADGVRTDGDDLVAPYRKQLVDDAPEVSTDDELSAEDEERLYRHYEAQDAPDADVPPPPPAATPAATAPAAPAPEGEMVRSEEQVSVGTRRSQTGTARMVKYIVTEERQVTVPVQREEVRIEYGPPGDDGEGVALHAEEPVVEKRVEPQERVHMERETVTEEESVTTPVREERIEVEHDDLGETRRPPG